MKKKLTLIVLLSLFFVAMAGAQDKQPTMVESTRDTLYPEIYQNWAGFVMHYQHPATELKCVDWGFFSTVESYDSYLWEVADSTFMPDGGNLRDSTIWCVFEHPGYIKVTVWDSIGNSGTDSIWFNIKDWVTPMENFHMEIDGTGHAVFSGVATSEHDRVIIDRAIDTVDWHNVYDSPLTPGLWSWRDDNAHFGQDTVWNYLPKIGDTCYTAFYPQMVPGMMMGTQPAPGGGWYITMKSILQARAKDEENYVYPLFTVDINGNRHPFIREGAQVILPASTNAYLIPDKHPDAYYQGAVAKLSPGKDNGYEILSYSNKVENPMPDVDVIDDHQEITFKVYPNPSSGAFVVEAAGLLHVTNVLGQVIKELEVCGQISITLPKGVYIIRNGDAVKKVVVN